MSACKQNCMSAFVTVQGLPARARACLPVSSSQPACSPARLLARPIRFPPNYNAARPHAARSKQAVGGATPSLPPKGSLTLEAANNNNGMTAIAQEDLSINVATRPPSKFPLILLCGCIFHHLSGDARKCCRCLRRPAPACALPAASFFQLKRRQHESETNERTMKTLRHTQLEPFFFLCNNGCCNPSRSGTRACKQKHICALTTCQPARKPACLRKTAHPPARPPARPPACTVVPCLNTFSP